MNFLSKYKKLHKKSPILNADSFFIGMIYGLFPFLSSIIFCLLTTGNPNPYIIIPGLILSLFNYTLILMVETLFIKKGYFSRLM